MEGTPELAVLEGAFALIKSKGYTLSTITRTDCAEMLEPLILAVSEIIQGLEIDHSLNEQRHWAWNTLAVLICRLSNDTIEPSHEDLGYLELAVPCLCNNVLFEVVTRCRLHEVFWELLSDINTLWASSLLANFLTYLAEIPHESHDSIFESLCKKYIETENNAYISAAEEHQLRKSDNRHIDMPNISYRLQSDFNNSIVSLMFPFQHLLCKESLTITSDHGNKNSACLEKVAQKLENTYDNVVKTQISLIEAFVKCLQCHRKLFDGSLSVSHNAILFAALLFYTSVQSFQAHILNASVIVKNAGDADIDMKENGHSVQQNGFLQHDTKINSDHNLEKTVSDNNIEEERIQALQSNLYYFKNLIVGILCDLRHGVTDWPSQLHVSIYFMKLTFSNFLELFAENPKMDGEYEKYSAKSENCVENLKCIMASLEAKIQAGVLEDCDRQLADILGLHIRRIEQKIRGWEGSMEWMVDRHRIEESVVSDERWLNCIQNNVDYLTTETWCQKLMNFLRGLSGPSTSALKQVVLSVYEKLPLVTQHSLFIDLHRDFDWDMSESYHQEITTIFNQIVSSKTGVQVPGRLMSLALQSPIQTLDKAVNYAVFNNGQEERMVKLLRCMPSVCSIKSHVEPPTTLLCSVVRKMLSCEALSEKQETNLLALIKLMIQPYCSVVSTGSPGSDPPVLSSRELMTSWVMPNLNVNGAGMLLRVIQVLCHILDQASPEGIQVWQPFPMILFLCQMMNCGIANADMQIKKHCMHILSILTKKFEEGNIQVPDHGFVWLHNQLCSLSWVSRLYADRVFSRFKDKTCGALKKLIPACVSDICELDENDWCLKHSTEDSEPTLQEGLHVLLQVCKTSDDMLQEIKQCVQPHKLAVYQPQHVYQAYVAAYIQLMPNCVPEEWCRMIDFTKFMIEEGVLDVPYQTTYITRLQLMDFTDLRIPLHLSQFLLDVVSIAHKMRCWYSSVQHWTGILIKHYANTMKDLSTVIHSSSQTSQGFTAYQLLCHICKVLSISLSWASDSLFVVALDLATQLKETNYTELVEGPLELLIKDLPQLQGETLKKNLRSEEEE